MDEIFEAISIGFAVGLISSAIPVIYGAMKGRLG